MTATTDLHELASHLFVDFQPLKAFAEEPFVLVEGKGIRVRDADGRWYIDGMAGVFTSSLGHGNEAIVAAASSQASQLALHAPLYTANLPALKLAERLREITPPGYTGVKLTAAGSEATEAAMKMARHHHLYEGRARRFKVLSHYRGFHGSTGNALAASGGPYWRAPFEPLPAGFIHVHAPFALTRRLGGSLPSPAAASEAALNLIEETIELEDPETISAFITEPIMLSAGVRVPPEDYLSRLHALCRRHGIVLIFDEIICGFGRTGRVLAAEHFGVTPDIVSFGKGIGAGYAALSGILVQEHIARTFWSDDGDTAMFRDGHTYGNNPVAAAVGLAVVEHLMQPGFLRGVEVHGAQLVQRLRAAALPAVVDVRGRGLLIGIELCSSGPSGAEVARAAHERGLILRHGPDFIALGPPLTITEAEIEEIAELTIESIRAASHQISSPAPSG